MAEPGSGTGVVSPGTEDPAAVPKRKVRSVTVVLPVTPGTCISNVDVSPRNGLWGPLPAIELLAALYVLPPGGPISVCAGAGGFTPRRFKVNVAPAADNPHPVDTLEPSVKEPPEATVRSTPELDVMLDEPDGVVLRVNCKPLMF